MRVDALARALDGIPAGTPTVVACRPATSTGRVRPDGWSRPAGPPAWCVGPCRWRVRLVGRRLTRAASPCDRSRGRAQLLGHRRQQDWEHPRGLRHHDRARRRGTTGRDGGSAKPTCSVRTSSTCSDVTLEMSRRALRASGLGCVALSRIVRRHRASSNCLFDNASCYGRQTRPARRRRNTQRRGPQAPGMRQLRQRRTNPGRHRCRPRRRDRLDVGSHDGAIRASCESR